jgi:hypothetical protein
MASPLVPLISSEIVINHLEEETGFETQKRMRILA